MTLGGLVLGTNTAGGYTNTGFGTCIKVCEKKDLTSEKFWLIKTSDTDHSLEGIYTIGCKPGQYVLQNASSSKDENANSRSHSMVSDVTFA